MGNREPGDRTVLLDHVDCTPVGECRDGQSREVRERRLVVERRREQHARVCDELPLFGQPALGLIEPRGADGGGGDVRKQ